MVYTRLPFLYSTCIQNNEEANFMDPAITLAPAASGAPLDALMSGYSLEMSARDLAAVEQSAGMLAPGTAIAITYLPGESTAARLQAAQGVRRSGFVPVPHLAARRFGSPEEPAAFLSALVQTAGVDRVFLVGGDLVPGQQPFPDALSLIRSGVLQRSGIRQTGVAGYPEGHPDIAPDRLAQALHDKISALREQQIQPYIVTQFGFDAAPILKWIMELRQQGIECPVCIGIPGPARLSTLVRYAAHCGVGASVRVMNRYGRSLASLVGSVGPSALLTELQAGLQNLGATQVSLHFYTFGGFKETATWLQSRRVSMKGAHHAG
jgi:methylenetetrahydrofolate reductase (NADPH)